MMKFEILTKFYRLQGLIIAFYSIWIALLAGSFGLLLVLDNRIIVITVIIPLLLVTSAIFSVYVNKKLKTLNKHYENEKGITEPPIQT